MSQELCRSRKARMGTRRLERLLCSAVEREREKEKEREGGTEG